MPNPHVVVFASSPLSFEEKSAMARALGDMVAGGTNVGFAVVQDSQELVLEVFERGVGWTDACGTGAAAAWAVGERLGFVEGKTLIRQPGGCLEVERGIEDRIWIHGSARLVFVGQWVNHEPEGGTACVEYLD
jgi:diaminopimelate epimerase